MKTIHEKCVEESSGKKYIDYTDGANIAGFKKVDEAMHAYGAV